MDDEATDHDIESNAYPKIVQTLETGGFLPSKTFIVRGVIKDHIASWQAAARMLSDTGPRVSVFDHYDDEPLNEFDLEGRRWEVHFLPTDYYMATNGIAPISRLAELLRQRDAADHEGKEYINKDTALQEELNRIKSEREQTNHPSKP